jgi:hypothetical protein
VVSGADTVVEAGADQVGCGVDSGAERVVCGTDTVVEAGADRVVSVACGEVVISVGDAGEVEITVVDGAGLVVVVGVGRPPAAEVAAMATVPAPSTPTVTAAATMALRDRSTAGIRMRCPLDERI